jgi:hypothetical protein
MHGTGHRTADRRAVVDDDAQLAAEVQDAIATLADLNERRRAREAEAERDRQPPQPASEIRRARVRALKLAYESRGLAWNESEALARLAEVEGRGIIR